LVEELDAIDWQVLHEMSCYCCGFAGEFADFMIERGMPKETVDRWLDGQSMATGDNNKLIGKVFRELEKVREADGK